MSTKRRVARVAGLSGRAIIMLTLFACTPTSSTTLATSLKSTQLRGLKGVNVVVDISQAFGSRQTPLETAIRKMVAQRLAAGQIAERSSASQYLEIDVNQVGAESKPCPQAVPIHISVRLREPVVLQRDSSVSVPGGGALIWWRDTYDSAAEDRLAEAVLDQVADLVQIFADEVRSVNP